MSKTFNPDSWNLYALSDHCFCWEEKGAPKSLIVEKKGTPFVGEMKGEGRWIYRLSDYQIVFDGLQLEIQRGRKTLLSGAIRDGHDGFSFRYKGPIYGLGDKFGPLDHQGHQYESWNFDPPEHHHEQMKSLYKSINFLAFFDPKDTIGIYYDNTSRCFFDLNVSDPELVSIRHQAGALRAYFFLGTLKEVVASFTELTGRGSLPPVWALGHQQSRFGYLNEADYDEVIQGYREAGIPLSAIYLDIDYMDGFADFTINETSFPNLASWVKEKEKEGVSVVPIVDCGVKAKEGDPIFEEGKKRKTFCTLNGRLFQGPVWPGPSVFPAFLDEDCRKWWKEEIKRFLSYGFAGIWNDMNEPTTFDGNFPDAVDMGGLPSELGHNVYAHFENKATYEALSEAGKRPFVLTRAAFAGTIKYAGMWTGDNTASWSHLENMIPQLCNMSLSGVSYVGVDIGGFKCDPTDELIARWAEASIFNPFFRNHSDHGRRQEGYLLKGKYREAYRNAVLLHYELIPYLYDLFRAYEETGEAVLRPLIYNYPEDSLLLQESSELMLGSSLLLAPALKPGESQRLLYLPDDFIEYATGKEYRKGHHILPCPPGHPNLFVRKNSLTPLAQKDEPKTLRLYWTGGEVSYHHYADEGDGLCYQKGCYILYDFHIDPQGNLKIKKVHEGMRSPYEKIVVESPDGKKRTILLN